MRHHAMSMLASLAAAPACLAGHLYNTGPIDVPIPNVNPGGVNITIQVPDRFRVADLNLGVWIPHTWQGDLVIRVTSPLGTSARLLNRPGTGSGAGGTFGYSVDDLGAGVDQLFWLDDGAARRYAAPDGDPPGDVARPGLPNVAGAWRPYDDSLSVFNGQSAFGTWIINVADVAGGQDIGRVRFIQLDFAAIPAPGSALIVCGLSLAPRRRRAG